MNEPTRQQLIAINYEFYTRYAESFSSTRDHPWPGWVRVLDGIDSEPLRVLDVGCGNGRLARFLQGARETRYVGIDTSAELIDFARKQTAGDDVRFEVCSASSQSWLVASSPSSMASR